MLELRNFVLVFALSVWYHLPLTRGNITWLSNHHFLPMLIMVWNNLGFLFLLFFSLLLNHIKLLFKAGDLVDQTLSAINRSSFDLG